MKHPGKGAPLGLVLTPGASAGADHPALIAIAEQVERIGVVAQRVDFPYRLAGRRAPDRPPVLMATIKEAAEALAQDLGTDTSRVALGGRSMGGRMCSMVVAEGLPTAALVLVSYPLHPPGRPEKLRSEHFAAIKVPTLFISGTRDAFGTPEELAAATKAIEGPVTHEWLDRGDHGLRRHHGDVAEIVARWLGSLAPQGKRPGGPRR